MLRRFDIACDIANQLYNSFQWTGQVALYQFRVMVRNVKPEILDTDTELKSHFLRKSGRP